MIKQKFLKKEWLAEGITLILVCIFTVTLMNDINLLQGNARAVNYAGIARGVTQRLVKLEISQRHNDELIDYLDKILWGLRNGGGEYNIAKLEDKDFQASLQYQMEMWDKLKGEIFNSRKGEETALLELSEDYFSVANQTVNLAEIYSDYIARELVYIEIILIFLISVMVYMFIHKTLDTVALLKQNNELSTAARIDAQTGLLNKMSCEEKISKIASDKNSFGFVMFDLNNLKAVNDSLGHKMGDSLICKFAEIIHKCADNDIHVGRYGGDEFVAMYKGSEKGKLLEFVSKVDREVENFNKRHGDFEINFARGFAFSEDFGAARSEDILYLADKSMYKDKALKKSDYSKQIKTPV